MANTYDDDVKGRPTTLGGLPYVDMNLLPDVDNSTLPQSNLTNKPKTGRSRKVRSTKES